MDYIHVDSKIVMIQYLIKQVVYASGVYLKNNPTIIKKQKERNLL